MTSFALVYALREFFELRRSRQQPQGCRERAEMAQQRIGIGLYDEDIQGTELRLRHFRSAHVAHHQRRLEAYKRWKTTEGRKDREKEAVDIEAAGQRYLDA